MKNTQNQNPEVQSFFEKNTNTITHIVTDPETKSCAIIDSVLDYNANSAKITFESADVIINYIQENNLKLEWIIETHAHADHLSAAPYIQEKLGGKIGIGEKIKVVQEVFGKVFNFGTEFSRDADQFDYLFTDNGTFKLGNINAKSVSVPGHTPADMMFIFGDSVFVGDTLFMPDFGTARCDFPGGNSEDLYNSIQKIYELPDDIKLFLCHDYLPKGRDKYVFQTTVKEEKENNIHVATDKNKEAFIKMRSERDKELDMPKLIIPSIQVNIQAGKLPEPEKNGVAYMKVPLNQL